MSNLGLLSRVHANFEDYAALLDDVLVELQAGRMNGPAAKRLRVLLAEAASVETKETSLRALVFANILSSPTDGALDDFADLAEKIGTPEQVPTLMKRLNRLSAHLEEERAALAHRLRR